MLTSKFAALSLTALGALTGGTLCAAAQSVLPGDPQATSYKPYRLSDRRADRPLTVKRRAPEPVVIVAPIPPSPFAGPGGIVMAPVHVAGALVGLPFKILGDVFPATGTVTASPLVLVGAPIQAAGQIAQFPFRVVDAAFTGSSTVR